MSSDTLPVWEANFEYGQPSDPQGFSFDTEWVLPDGLGGYAMGSISGVPMRRYHGLLCASLSPPVCRAILLNAFDELIHIPQGGVCGTDLDVRLTGFQFPDQDPPIENPYLTGFVKSIDSCSWTYSIPSQLGRVHIRKTLTIADRVGGCRVEYEIESGIDSDLPITIEIRPLVSMRDFHELNHPGVLQTEQFQIKQIIEPAVQGVAIKRDGFDPTLSIRGINIGWETLASIWRNVSYHHDTLRQQDDREDLYSPGMFTTTISQGESTSLSIESTIADEPTTDWNKCSSKKETRTQSSINFALDLAGNPDDQALRDAISTLVIASDDFIVKRIMKDRDSVSVLAGYPWFSDWGRDTMIALPGLFLTTGRFDEAHQTLTTFANAIEHGLIPNRFDDAGGSSHYNTVDASLWFIHACDQWSQATGKPLDQGLIDACDQIIDAYMKGTINKIGMDESDGLISAGDANTQLTWMDALRDGIAFTPRHGKAIEINALWINALEARARFNDSRKNLIDLADQARQSLMKKMSPGPADGLIDCLFRVDTVRTSEWVQSDELRPNQAFACALPGVRLTDSIARRAIHAVGDALLTPIGLRTLDPSHPNYCPHYQGSMTDRDNAYHNGTAWPWLLGAYCEGLMRVNNFDAESRKKAQAVMLGLVSKMGSDSVGQLFEIYDAEPTDGVYQSQGCMAQAWSIAEALRVLVISCQS